VTQIGRYQVTGEAGRGAMGVVYRALDQTIGRTVAIKTIRITDAQDEAERRRLTEPLLREAASAGRLSHPNIVTIFDIAEDGDTAYIAMELVDGPSLDKRMHEEPPLDGEAVLRILRHAADALDYAHRNGVIHRDIKPANILLHHGTVAKITDFGVAKIQSHHMTLSGSLIGTPNYMSPEQIQGQPVNGRSDQFSLAVIAYELLTGEKPFQAPSIAALVFKIVREEPPLASSLNQSIGWPVDKVLGRAMSKEPGLRFDTCAAFVTALENALKSSKGWKPMPPGSVASLPTMRQSHADLMAESGLAAKHDAGPSHYESKLDEGDLPTVQVPVVKRESAREEKLAPVPFASETETPEEEPPRRSTALRVARAAAALVFFGGLLAGILITGYEYFSSGEEPQTAQAPTPAPSPEAPRPSAVGEKVPQPEPAPTETKTEPTKEEDSQPEIGNPREPVKAPEPAQPPPVKAPPVKAAEDARTKEAAPTAGSMRFVTAPPGATVQVDGGAQNCVSPCQVDLPRGRHTLVAKLVGFREERRIFNVPADVEVFINMQRTTGTLAVRSDPAGASIVVDGTPRMEKTPAVLTLPTGSHRIEVRREGYRPSQQSVDVKDSGLTNMEVKLTSDGNS
jgi:serine/threonine protein kinase